MILLFIVLVCIGGAVFFLLEQPASPSDQNANKPNFIFDATKAPGWWTAGTNHAKAEDFDLKGQGLSASDIPIADISIHQGKQNDTSDCFVMYFYNDQTVDPATKLQELTAKALKGNENSWKLNELAVTDISMQISGDTKTYQLHQYDLIGSGNEQIMHGMAYGVLPLADGHIDIRGVCSSGDKLPTILPVLQTTSFNY